MAKHKSDMKDILDSLEGKYDKQKQPIETYLKGLLYAKPINYWDYIEVETLLSLQKPRTDLPDEMIFIMYHQVTELLLKLIKHEIEQMTNDDLDVETFIVKMGRVNRYAEICANTFDVMGTGMDPEQYDKFRLTLTPASGFQSATFREIEIMCTPLNNLVSNRFKEELSDSDDLELMLGKLYWQEAGINHETGEKSMTLSLFEEKYRKRFFDLAHEYKDKNLLLSAEKLNADNEERDRLNEAMKSFDRTYNIAWPKVHLRTAEIYLEHGQKVKAATGGSDWKKYLHPKYQRRMFFPGLLSEEEFANWGKD